MTPVHEKKKKTLCSIQSVYPSHRRTRPVEISSSCVCLLLSLMRGMKEPNERKKQSEGGREKKNERINQVASYCQQ